MRSNRRARPTYRFSGLAALVAAAALTLSLAAAGHGRPAGDYSPTVAAGIELLLHRPLSSPAFTIADLDRLWTVWEPAERARAERATPDERRALAFARYGFTRRPDDAAVSASSLPLGYTTDSRGNLYPNCLACHGGEVAGRVIIGLANTQQDVQTLLDDLAALRAQERGGDANAARAGATLGFPMNFARGVTNATQYSILLGSMRDENLDLVFPPSVSQEFVHNDVDAPAWWHFRKKRRIYFDGMAPKTVRTLMQFTMAPGLSGEKIRGWEDEFVTIRDAIDELEPPTWPYEVDHQLAARGRQAFEATCARCHGTYGEDASYPSEVVPYSLVNTDPVRLDAISPDSKRRYNRSWFSDYGKHPVELESRGYVAPPLDGVWASAPYFHNGAVPTLWHVLHPDRRPGIWCSSGTAETDYDRERVGLRVEELERVPDGLSARELRGYYDTAVASHDGSGHRFPDQLDEEQRAAVLEYLKTL